MNEVIPCRFHNNIPATVRSSGSDYSDPKNRLYYCDKCRVSFDVPLDLEDYTYYIIKNINKT